MQIAFDFGPSESLARTRPEQAPRSRRGPEVNTQPCLPGLERKSSDNLFLALRPDREMADLVERRVLPHARVAGGFSERSRGVDLFHVTLLGLGLFEGVPKARVASICAVLRQFAYPSFDVELNMLMHFDRAIVLTGDGARVVRDFSSELQRTLASGGVRRLGPVCSKPHMTLLYSKRPFGEHKVQPVRWRVREFVLIHSLVGQSRHVVLERWPLLVNEADRA